MRRALLIAPGSVLGRVLSSFLATIAQGCSTSLLFCLTSKNLAYEPPQNRASAADH